jgi:tetratricopeptide (TPR) repeat protein
MSLSEADLDARLAEAAGLIERGELDRDHILVENGTRLLVRILNELPSFQPRRGRVFSLLGAGRLRLFDLTGNASVLDEAIDDLTNAVALTAESAAPLVGRTFNLADAHVTRYDLAGELLDLDTGISLLRGVTADDPAEQAEFLIALGRALLRRFERDASVDKLDEASACLQEAIRLGPDSNWLMAAVGSLAAVAAHRARSRHDSAPIDDAVAFLRGKLGQPDGAPIPVCQCQLGSLLLERHRLFDDPDAQAKAATLLRSGLAGLEKSSPDRPAFLARFVETLGHRTSVAPTRLWSCSGRRFGSRRHATPTATTIAPTWPVCCSTGSPG